MAHPRVPCSWYCTYAILASSLHFRPFQRDKATELIFKNSDERSLPCPQGRGWPDLWFWICGCPSVTFRDRRTGHPKFTTL